MKLLIKTGFVLGPVFFFLSLGRNIFAHETDVQEAVEPETMTTSLNPVLVIGATGATGKHVVRQLLDQQRPVRVIVRSEERMLFLLQNHTNENLLQVTEASLLNLTDSELEELVQDTDAVIQTLGHNMDLAGIFGQPRDLVAQATKRLTQAQLATINKRKFVLMGTVGVFDQGDTIRSWSDRAVLNVLRWTLVSNFVSYTFVTFTISAYS
jgi:nucleoside-diphosphate-sugar epimerase